MVTPEQEIQLQDLAAVQGISVARLLTESALNAKPDLQTELLSAVNGLRRMISDEQTPDVEKVLRELLNR